MMRKFGFFFAVVLAALLTGAARAQLTLTLPNPITVTAGGSVLVSGTILNGVGQPALDLSSLDLALQIDDPLSTDGGASYSFIQTLGGGESAAGDFFTVSAPLTANPGLYSGSLTLFNGATPVSPLTSFTVNVTAAPPANAPEPASLGMCALGVFGLALRRRRR